MRRRLPVGIVAGPGFRPEITPYPASMLFEWIDSMQKLERLFPGQIDVGHGSHPPALHHRQYEVLPGKPRLGEERHEMAKATRIVFASITDDEPHHRVLEKRLTQDIDGFIEAFSGDGLDPSFG